MPGQDFTTAGLLAAIRRRGRIPELASDYTDSVLLLNADTAIKETFLPLVLRSRADYYYRSEDQTIVANQQRYVIPALAALSTLRKVEWIDSAGNEQEVYPLLATDVSNYALQTGTPERYAVRDDELILCPTPNAALGTLRVWYEYRPAKLVSTGYFTVESVTSTTVTLTASVTWTAASRYDFVKATPPFALLGASADPTGTGTGVTLTFPSDTIPSRLAAGDFMCLPGEAPVAQIPGDMHDTLALAAAVETLWQYAPSEASAKDALLQRALQQWQETMVPRTRGRTIKQVNRNSAIRRGGTGRRWSGNFEP